MIGVFRLESQMLPGMAAFSLKTGVLFVILFMVGNQSMRSSFGRELRMDGEGGQAYEGCQVEDFQELAGMLG